MPCRSPARRGMIHTTRGSRRDAPLQKAGRRRRRSIRASAQAVTLPAVSPLSAASEGRFVSSSLLVAMLLTFDQFDHPAVASHKPSREPKSINAAISSARVVRTSVDAQTVNWASAAACGSALRRTLSRFVPNRLVFRSRIRSLRLAASCAMASSPLSSAR